MEDITDADYAHAKRVCKEFEIKNLGEYHDLFVQSDTLLLVVVFKDFRNTCLKIYELDPAKVFASPGLAWQATLKKIKVKLDLLTDIGIGMLSMVEKGIARGICHSIYWYAKANNKYIKEYDKERIWYEWIKDAPQFEEYFLKNYNKESDERYFLEVDVQYLNKLHELRNDLSFLPERMNTEKKTRNAWS